MQGIIEQAFPFYKVEEVDLKGGESAIDKDLVGLIVTQPQKDAVDGALDNNSRYGLGIIIGPDGVLWHNGDAGGFHSAFLVSADRDHAIAVACNSNGIEPFDIANALVRIWQTT
jgi:hypothetical protein